MPAPGPMPPGFGAIRTLAGPQGPQGPHDAFAPMTNMPLLSSDSSPEARTASDGELTDDILLLQHSLYGLCYEFLP